MGNSYEVKNIDRQDLGDLRENFKKFLEKNYSYLNCKGTICSDAFYIFRKNIGITFDEVLEEENGLTRYKELLYINFQNKGRKNPISDASTYCNALKYLVEFVRDNEESYKKRIHSFRESFNRNKIIDNVNLNNSIDKNKVDFNEVVINTPTPKEVEKYLEKWEKSKIYKAQESALDKLFFDIYPRNKSIEDVLIKVSALNDFYSTNIYNTFNVSNHILELDIDERLRKNDMKLVNDIAKVKMDNGNIINFYSFATKYCSHHNPLEYPIYDSYVEKILKYFRDRDKFFEFRNCDFKDYEKFKEILIQFKIKYGLKEFSLKEIDKYIWLLGKEKFPKSF